MCKVVTVDVCMNCGVKLPNEVEADVCCSGYMCGCQGLPEPVFCDECSIKIFNGTG